MANIIEVKLKKDILPNYADPDWVIVLEGDKIRFNALDATFIVEFVNPDGILDSNSGPMTITPETTEEERTTGEFLPNGSICYYIVKAKEKSKFDPGRPKMIVKAIR